jgi:hypothetical protein
MSPNYEADPDGPKIVPRDKWFAAPASSDPFAGVSSGPAMLSVLPSPAAAQSVELPDH